MDDPITRAEHAEFAKRMEDENRRQNHRIDNLENSIKAFEEIANSVNRLATNMETMTTELSRQGERLETLERKPGDSWNAVLRSILTGIGAAIAVAIVAAIANNIIK